ncbi:MAG: hypothetical protein CMK59_03845 [Proteobacteria bacterium]|nr:hypothetical protein [Pseudomonadota bacterium]
MIFIIGLSLVFAATLTDGPGALQGDIAINYQFEQSLDTLTESNQDLMKRNYTAHLSQVYLEFGIIDQISVSTTFPRLRETLSFTDPLAVSFDPEIQMGSYLKNEALMEMGNSKYQSSYGEWDNPNSESSELIRTGRGGTGTWLGMHFFPFHERFYRDRGDLASWRLSVSYRLPDQTNFFTEKKERRGSGPGTAAWMFEGAFSKVTTKSEPYLTFSFVFPQAKEIDVVTGASYSGEISPAKEANFRTGIEFFTWRDTALGHYLGVELISKTGYRSWSSLPTGVFLPSVLTFSENEMIAQGDQLYATAGVGLNLQVATLYSVRWHFNSGVSTPQIVEHAYPVNTSGAFIWNSGLEFRFRYRTSAS